MEGLKVSELFEELESNKERLRISGTYYII